MEEIKQNHPDKLKEMAAGILKYVKNEQPPERVIMAFCGGLIKGILDVKKTNPFKRKIYGRAYDELINKEFSNN